MAYKPGDFFVGVNEFLGILVPGTILLFLQRQFFAGLLDYELGADTKTRWVAFFLGAYILGHFLLAFGVPINRFLYRSPLRWFSEKGDAFYKEARPLIGLPEEEGTRADAFHRAYSFVRLHNPSAAADIERQMGEYQLFRSLILVFGLDLLLAVFREFWEMPLPLPRIIFSAVLFLLVLGRFPFLLKWTYRTTFEYYTLLRLSQDREDQNKTPNPADQADR